MGLIFRPDPSDGHQFLESSCSPASYCLCFALSSDPPDGQQFLEGMAPLLHVASALLLHDPPDGHQFLESMAPQLHIATFARILGSALLLIFAWMRF